jgi:hypothetical protein
MATPQQEFTSAETKGNGPNGMPSQQGAPGRNNYQIVTPLGSLQQGPICGAREMTRAEFVSGGTTQ